MGAKTIVYIDGFNFYYGAVRGTRFKWLNLEACFRRLRQNDQLRRGHYFTAIIDGGQKRARQKQYLRASATSVPEPPPVLREERSGGRPS